MGGFWRRGGGASRDRDGARPGDLDSGLSGQTGISQPEKATLGRGGRRSGQGLRPGDRMGGREEGLGGTGAGCRCPEGGGDQSPSQRPDFPQKLPRIPKLRTLPSVGAGRRAQPPGSPGPCPCPRPQLSLPYFLPPSLPLPPASQQSSQGHPWAHKIKYLKDVGNVSQFLWQQENNSHFPDTLKESTFPPALRVANYF